MLAEARGRTDGEDFFDRRPRFEFSADNIELPVDASKSGNNEYIDAINKCRRLETAPRFGGRRDKQMISTVRANFSDFKARSFLALPQATGRYQFA